MFRFRIYRESTTFTYASVLSFMIHYNGPRVKYGILVVEHDFPNKIWDVYREDKVIGRIYQLSAATYRASCCLDHPANLLNGSTCGLFLSSKNDEGGVFLDLLAWIGGGTRGKGHALNHWTAACELKQRYARHHVFQYQDDLKSVESSRNR